MRITTANFYDFEKRLVRPIPRTAESAPSDEQEIFEPVKAKTCVKSVASQE